MAAFVGVFNLLRVVAPGAVDAIREGYKRGGLSGVRARIVEALDDEERDTPAELVGLRERQPHELTLDDWKKVAGLPTMAAARKATALDPKTIRKYLAKHEVVPRWSEAKTLDVGNTVVELEPR
jgi:hypothetical protein